MTRKELLDSIDEAIRTEESAVGLYMKHMGAVVMRMGRLPEDVERAREIMDFLAKACKRHKTTLENVRRDIQAKEDRVY